MQPSKGWRCSPLLRPARSLFVFALALPAAAQDRPRADFVTAPNPAEGGAPLTVQFLDRSTGQITSWAWEFGDGTISPEASPTHVYTVVGPKDVTLTVSGPLGTNSKTLVHAVDVLETLNGVVGAPHSLATMPVPMPKNLGQFVKDMPAAVRLGKALFWDIQVGSDGMTACASCHYHAGVDNRPINTLHPGADGVFDVMASGAGGGPNYLLNAGDFPFRKYLDPNIGGAVVSDSDDRRGAAGVLNKTFTGTNPGITFDAGMEDEDGTFQVDGARTLQVTGRDAPTTIGAIFFHRIFWDGRANHFFNGRNIWGNQDPSAPTVLEMQPDGGLGEVSILLENAAAASQAIGPPLSDVEMSWTGRSWPDLGRKMVGRAPLANQHVDSSDSVLGDLAAHGDPGLEAGIDYADLIRAAFHERWWGSSELTQGFSQMEANFSLFFGLAVQCYEATLVPDQAPYDLWAAGDLSALTEQEVRGLSFFTGAGRCTLCHGTPLFAGGVTEELLIHSETNEGEGILERMPMANAFATGGMNLTNRRGPGKHQGVDGAELDFTDLGVGIYNAKGRLLAWTMLPAGLPCVPAGSLDLALTRTANMPALAGFQGKLRVTSDGNCGIDLALTVEWNANGPADGRFQLRACGTRFPMSVPLTSTAVYDNGFYNIGVRADTEDAGVGGNGPFGPLSITERSRRGEDIGQDGGIGRVKDRERAAVIGAFKTPTLRNIELTGPYFHNGGMATLEQVVEFYARGGDFQETNARNVDPDVSGFPLTEQNKADLVAFLKTLTDPRVRHEAAPFDHPELLLKEGQIGDHETVLVDGNGSAVPRLVHKGARGASGGPSLPPFEDRLAASISVAVVAEDSSGADLALICDKRPEANVSVSLWFSDPGMATLSQHTVTFTPDDWRVTRRVRVTTVDPNSAGGTSLIVGTNPAVSSDPEFSGLAVRDVELDFLPDILLNTAGSGSRTGATTPGGVAATGKQP